MLTVKQVARELGMSAACVYQLVGTGKLVSHRFGVGRGAIRVCESDLAVFVDGSRKEKRPQPPTASRATKSQNGFKHLRLDD
jgi:excisionase family DNA binding protein